MTAFPAEAADAVLRTDFRSDTLTLPTPEMLEAMVKAPLGDDVLGEDPTVNALESEAARLLGKEAALFVASGTQGNLLALLSLARPGDEVIVEATSHIANFELGGAARLGGLSLRTVAGECGKLQPDLVAAAVRPANAHYPVSALVCVENAHNAAGGTVTTPAEMEALADVAAEHRLKVHVDGARLFNASVALGVPAVALVRRADTVTFCLSKGLSAPVGSVLVGSQATIAAARGYRKMIGGGMRQAGVIAAAGLVALRTGVERLAEDHRRARVLAEGLAAIPGITLDLRAVQINTVRFDVGGLGMSADQFIVAMAAHGIRISGGYGRTRASMMLHRHIDDAAVEQALAAAQLVARGGQAAKQTSTLATWSSAS